MDLDTGRAPADRDLLMQARVSALASLQTACAPAHRAALEETIAELDRRLAEVAQASASHNSQPSWLQRPDTGR